MALDDQCEHGCFYKCSYPRITAEVEKDDGMDITPEEDSGERHSNDC